MDDLGHQICMGIRHGLFGASTIQEANIGNEIAGIADAITEGLHNGTINVRIKNEI